ncbi:LuxR C-terminal-related transcriptional regulator [Rhodohalobacter halophilus]|uniref:LuxR C-terminal-related transcriptional regulator n=1 Tax=Rhodohalobacter halophilus TaxID=1812810 RepID=UPI00083FA442|nr:response regulator transcription factor [Rhodohalobacter halophilus]
MNKIKVLIAENFDVYRHGLRSILSEAPAVSEVYAVRSAKDLVQAYKKSPDSVCIVSSNIEGSNIHDLMQRLEKVQPAPKVIVLTYSTDVNHLNQSLKAGVNGYLMKNCTTGELESAIKEVAKGKQAFSKSVSQMMANKYVDQAKKTGSVSNKLTKRETEVLKLIVEGHTSPEIAKMLFISPRTVETHRSNLMNKLKIKNTAALVRYALEKTEIG